MSKKLIVGEEKRRGGIAERTGFKERNLKAWLFKMGAEVDIKVERGQEMKDVVLGGSFGVL